MTKEKILDALNTLHEHKMAKDIFIPILKKMGLKGVRFTGGVDELGIDVEYYEHTEPEKNKSYVGIQFKKGDLVYSSSGSKGSVKEVKNQAEEAFEKEIHDLDGRGVHYISRFIVATTGDINDKARQYIAKARLKGSDRRIDYWTGDRLAEYVQDHWMEEFKAYFKVPDETVEDESLSVVDAEYIEENYEKLIEKCRRVRSTVNSSEWEIIETIFLFRVENNEDPTMADLLMELGNTEDFFDTEFRHLSRLGYLEGEEGQLYLTGYAHALVELYDSIVQELEDADEDPSLAMDIYNVVMS